MLVEQQAKKGELVGHSKLRYQLSVGQDGFQVLVLPGQYNVQTSSGKINVYKKDPTDDGYLTIETTGVSSRAGRPPAVLATAKYELRTDPAGKLLSASLKRTEGDEVVNNFVFDSQQGRDPEQLRHILETLLPPSDSAPEELKLLAGHPELITIDLHNLKSLVESALESGSISQIEASNSPSHPNMAVWDLVHKHVMRRS